MTWTYSSETDMFHRDNPRFAANRPERIRRHNLPCTDGDTARGVMGTRHTYESWGEDAKNFGAAGFWDCEIFVCTNPGCMRTKQGKRIRPN